MTTSGISTFNATRNDIIYFAGRKLVAQGSGVQLSDQEMSDFAFQLNAMVKEWQASGLHVWTVTEATLFPQPGQVTYQVGSGAADHVTQTYVASSLTVAGVVAAGSVTLASVAGMTLGDFIGVVLDAGNIFWTTIAGISGSVATLTAGLTGTAQIANAVYTYTRKIPQPLRVVDARRYAVVGAQETPLAPIMEYLDYRRIPNKTDQGLTSQLSYNRQLGIGFIYLWLAPADVTNLINMTWWRPIMDFTASADTPDLPQEWVNTLGWNLALLMAPEYSVPAAQLAEIKEQAAWAKDAMGNLDREMESIRFEPRRGRRRW